MVQDNFTLFFKNYSQTSHPSIWKPLHWTSRWVPFLQEQYLPWGLGMNVLFICVTASFFINLFIFSSIHFFRVFLDVELFWFYSVSSLPSQKTRGRWSSPDDLLQVTKLFKGDLCKSVTFLCYLGFVPYPDLVWIIHCFKPKLCTSSEKTRTLRFHFLVLWNDISPLTFTWLHLRQRYGTDDHFFGCQNTPEVTIFLSRFQGLLLSHMQNSCAVDSACNFNLVKLQLRIYHLYINKWNNSSYLNIYSKAGYSLLLLEFSSTLWQLSWFCYGYFLVLRVEKGKA